LRAVPWNAHVNLHNAMDSHISVIKIVSRKIVIVYVTVQFIVIVIRDNKTRITLPPSCRTFLRIAMIPTKREWTILYRSLLISLP